MKINIYIFYYIILMSLGVATLQGNFFSFMMSYTIVNFAKWVVSNRKATQRTLTER